jgi:seryl-tRNA synthetase
MVDINHVRENPDIYIEAVKNKNSKVDINHLIELSNKVGSILKDLEEKRAESNTNAELIKKSIADGGKPEKKDIDNGKRIKSEVQDLEKQYSKYNSEYLGILETVPNLPSHDTPIGPDEDSNQVIRKWGEPRDFDSEGFKPKEHWELGQELDIIDSERAAKVSGSRFTYLKGDLALMQFALVQLGFNKLTDPDFISMVIDKYDLCLEKNTFIPVVPPVIINPIPYQKMARLEPKDERYHLDQDDQYLVGSAEHTLGAMHMDEVFDYEELPKRYVGYSTAFRREAGSYGKDTKGIIRLHQFDKLEMESFTTPETSLQEQNLFVAIQEELMQLLDIPYQVIITSTGDQGDPDARHLDVECWMPGQGKYRETHSADLMTDYQSRRLQTRYRDKKTGKNELVHTNDATVFAIGRTLVAIIENYQQKDGSILIPKVLRNFLGKDRIS